MPNQKQFQTEILLSGHVDPSVQKAFARAQDEINRLNKQLKGIAKQAGINNFQVGKMPSQFKAAQTAADRLSASMRRIGEMPPECR